MKYLENINVTLYGYDQIDEKIIEYGASLTNKKITIDIDACSSKYFNLLKD